jgi:subtilisin family serine protease
MGASMRWFALTLPLLFAAGAPNVARAAAPVPQELLEQAEREGRAPVIVRLAAPGQQGRETAAQRTARRARIEQVADAALARIGGADREDLRRFRALPLLALEPTPGELAALAAADEVLAIEADRALQPSLAESIPRVGASVTTSAGWDGSGTALVIADTGVEASHPFLGGRVVAEACFSFGRDCPNGQKTQFGAGSAAPCSYGSLCWHGTHVAGIAAGANETMHGAAPGASLIAIQTGSESSCDGTPCVLIYDSDALAALDYVGDTLSLSWSIAAVNMSFGSTTTWSSESSCDASNSAYKLAFDALHALGIAPVVAAGNESSTTGIGSPACVSSAIAVGASFDTGDVVWSGSNSGPPLDLLAPGTNIRSSLTGGGYGSRTGTSMATPHVTGAFAVLRHADPSASVSTLKLALEGSGLPITDTRNGLVRPRIQLDDAVRSRAPAACFDGLDNDGDGAIDVDGDGGTPDPHCTSGFDGSENTPSSCGLGPELALLLPLIGLLRVGRRRNRGGRPT